MRKPRESSELKAARAELARQQIFLKDWKSLQAYYDNPFGRGHWKAHYEIALSKIYYLENVLIPNLESGVPA